MKRIVTTIACLLALAGCVDAREDAPPDIRAELVGTYTGTFSVHNFGDPSRDTSGTAEFRVSLNDTAGATWVDLLADPLAPRCPPITLSVNQNCDLGYACGVQLFTASCASDGLTLQTNVIAAVWDGVNRFYLEESVDVRDSADNTAYLMATFDGRK